MREIRLSGSEGGGTGNSTGSPYPYPTTIDVSVGAGHARDTIAKGPQNDWPCAGARQPSRNLIVPTLQRGNAARTLQRPGCDGGPAHDGAHWPSRAWPAPTVRGCEKIFAPTAHGVWARNVRCAPNATRGGNCPTTLNPQEIDRRTIDASILRQHSGEENQP